MNKGDKIIVGEVELKNDEWVVDCILANKGDMYIKLSTDMLRKADPQIFKGLHGKLLSLVTNGEENTLWEVTVKVKLHLLLYENEFTLIRSEEE